MQAKDFLVVPARQTLYFLRYLVALSRNHCCPDMKQYLPFSIPVGEDVPDRNKILFSFAMEM